MADTTNAPVRFHGASFAPPGTLVDTSVLSFVDKVGTPTLSLTIAQDTLTGGEQALKVYVDDQQRAAQKAVPGYAMTGLTERNVAGAAAVLVEGQAPSPGKKRHVSQLYVLDAARERVFVVTATCADTDAVRAKDAVEQLAKTFKLEGSR
jgi:hypothetical protein